VVPRDGGQSDYREEGKGAISKSGAKEKPLQNPPNLPEPPRRKAWGKGGSSSYIKARGEGGLHGSLSPTLRFTGKHRIAREGEGVSAGGTG